MRVAGRALALALLVPACTVLAGIESGEPQCRPNDHVKNGLETDVDCGGGCGKCPDGAHCGKHEDCASNACFDGTCVAPECDDGRKNGQETGVDCGGPDGNCQRCTGGDPCLVDEDCASMPEAVALGVEACVGGVCHASCCFDDCEPGCGCANPDEPEPSCCPATCAAKHYGASCDPDLDDVCAYPLECFGDVPGQYRCF